MDEVFGEDNFVSQIAFKKTTGAGSPTIGTDVLASVQDYLLWFSKDINGIKYRQMYSEKEAGAKGAASYNRVQSVDGATVMPIRAGEEFERDFDPSQWHLFASDNLTSQTGGETTRQPALFRGVEFRPAKGGWNTNVTGMNRLLKSSRVTPGGSALRYIRRITDFPVYPINNEWEDTGDRQLY